MCWRPATITRRPQFEARLLAITCTLEAAQLQLSITVRLLRFCGLCRRVGGGQRPGGLLQQRGARV